MSNVLIEKDKLDVLATAISNKSGEPLKMTLAEMVEAVDGIETGGGITPTGNIDITGAGVTDVTQYATATVPTASFETDKEYGFFTQNSTRQWRMRARTALDPEDGGAEGWHSSGVQYSTYTVFNVVPTGTAITPTESAQTVGGSNYHMEGAVTVNAIPSNYVGSGITQRSSSDLTASGATVTVPSGYYSAQASKSVANGNLGTPTVDISKTSLDYDIDISFPSFSHGYIDVEPSVEVSLDIEDKSVTPSTSQQVITPTDELCYLNSVTVNAMPSGTATAPTTISGTAATVSTGTNTLTLSKTVSVTPQVTTAGYVSAGTAGNSAVSLTANVTTQGAQTIYPSSSDQTINSGRYLTGNQTIKAVTTSNLTADNIKSGVTVKVGDSADADRVLSVTGTYSGGGGSSMNVQIAQSTNRATSSTYTNVISLTCSTAGTYDIYWDCFRSSTSGTSGSQLYVGGTAYGTANTVFTNHAQTNHLTGVTLQANQTVAVYARSRGSNYYAYVGTLIIKQTA